jgi:hypothetical protein
MAPRTARTAADMSATRRPPAPRRGASSRLDPGQRDGHIHRSTVRAVQHPDSHQAPAGTAVPPLVAVVGQHSIEVPDGLDLSD